MRANNEYLEAAQYARNAGTCASQARDNLADCKDLSERKSNWERIMSTVPVVPFTVVFVLVCVVEYIFSKEIYRDIFKSAPWVIAIAFIAVAIFISEMIVYRLFHQKRTLKHYELRRDPNLKQETDEKLNALTMRFTNRAFAIGIVFLLLMLAALYWLSMERVNRELSAGLRNSGFGIQDMLPVILYVFEVATGLFVWHLIRKWHLNSRVNRLRSAFEQLVRSCSDATTRAVNKYGLAEKEGYNAVESPVSDDIHEAFYRNDQRDVNNRETYIAPVEMSQKSITLHLKDTNGNPVKANVSCITDFKLTGTEASDNAGMVVLEIDSCEGDSVRDIIITQPGVEPRNITGAYSLGREHHVLI